MSRQRNGLELPKSLQEEIGLDLNRSKDSEGRPIRSRPLGRKEQRKADRQERKQGHARQTSDRFSRSRAQNSSFSERPAKRQRHNDEVERRPVKPKSTIPTPAPKPILKKSKPRQPSPELDDEDDEDEDDNSVSERSQSPGLVIDKNSRSYKDQLGKDDAEISALEKKLGIKSKKLPKAFDDGLADLLDGIDDIFDDDAPKKRKREADEWLESKRRKAQQLNATDEDDEEEGEEEDMEDFEGMDDMSDEDEEGEEDDIEDDDDDDEEGEFDEDDFDEDVEGSEDEDNEFGGFESEDEAVPIQPKKRENPYVAPVTGEASVTKYIPPSLRKQSGSVSEALERLRRQLQGHINKLSEANILSIVGEVEKLYASNPRQDVTTTLIDLLLTSFSDRSQLQNTFVILHAAFISAIYKVIGTDFGAEVVSRIVDQFDKFYTPNGDQSGKEAVNMISLLAHLYTFHVVSSVLLFDYIRLFLADLSEMNTELLLKVVRECGPQLRQDDPSSLKDIVLIMQGTVTKATSENQQISVRTKFMIETITDLKNNKLRSGAAGITVAIEHITRMRKALGSLNNARTIKATEPLRIGLNDFKNSNKRGKWWLVGASWKEAEKVEKPEAVQMIQVTVENDGEPDLLALAQQHRMNTSIRRSIFVAIMSATDFRDAHLRLMKLRLKKSQELEIPRVLLHCSGAEDVYNPYYTFISKQLCFDNKKMQKAFQFALWGFFKRLGERPEDEDEDEEDSEAVELKEIVNLAKMYGHLIVEGTMTLAILRTLNLVYLKDQAKMFVEVLLVTIITRSQAKASDGPNEKPLINIFLQANDAPSVSKGLQYFVKKVLRKTDLVSSKKEAKTVKWACGVIDNTLKHGETRSAFASDDDDDFN